MRAPLWIMSEQTAASKYREYLASRPLELVDVKVPSGFVFKFRKPNALGIVMNNELPQSVASDAVEEWKKQGVEVAEAEQSTETKEQTQIRIGKKMFEIRDRTLELSYSPKIVIGKANPSKDELSTDEISNEDLTYLFQFIAAGGETSIMLATFSQGREQRVVAGIDGKKLRKARKRTDRT